MSHANAALTPVHRARIGRLVVEEGWSVAEAARFFRVSYPTAAKWARRYAEMGRAGMEDRSSRPHRSPTKTAQPLVRKIVHVRIKKRVGPVEIASRTGIPASTVYAVLKRCRLNRLSHVDVRTGEVIRRYEHNYPGSMIHVDVKKLGNIPWWRAPLRGQTARGKEPTHDGRCPTRFHTTRGPRPRLRPHRHR